jgi:hypothetical protein
METTQNPSNGTKKLDVPTMMKAAYMAVYNLLNTWQSKPLNESLRVCLADSLPKMKNDIDKLITRRNQLLLTKAESEITDEELLDSPELTECRDRYNARRDIPCTLDPGKQSDIAQLYVLADQYNIMQENTAVDVGSQFEDDEGSV